MVAHRIHVKSMPWLNWQPHPAWFPWQLGVYFLLVIITYGMITFPLSYDSTNILPHRYGISVMSLRAWLRDQGIGFLLSTILEVLFVSLIIILCCSNLNSGGSGPH